MRLADRDGAPSAGDTLVYRVVQGSGVISGDLDSGSRVGMVITNAQGEANLSWRLGRRSGPGANRLQVEGLRGRGQLFLSATAQGDSLVRLQISGGDHQRGLAGSPAPWPVVALVTDTLNNPLEGEAVTFQATRGGGHFGGYDTITVMTGADGKATALWTLGETTIPEGQVVEAYLRRPLGLDPVADSVDALFGTLSVSSRMRSLPAVFRATALKGGPIESTTVTGVVLDNQNDPLPGVTVILEELGLRAVTDETGHFRIPAMVSGIRHLKVIGATSSRPGKWVSLHFEINIVTGVENHLGMPIYLLSENERPESAKRPRVDSAVTLTVAEVPGFSLTVPQGSARFPFEWDDARRVVSVTPVHLDKIPMPPGEGMQPVVVVSIQPMDVKFDIPAPVAFPNVDRLPPGEQTNMYSFDHDLGTFVKIGTGTVSEDGSVIVSDPGYGIVHGGWHCAGPSNPTGSARVVAACCEGAGGSGSSPGKAKQCPPDPDEVNGSAGGLDLPEGAKGKVAEGKFKGDPAGGTWTFEYSLDNVGMTARPVSGGSTVQLEFTSDAGTIKGLGSVKGIYKTPSGGESKVNMPVRVGMGKLSRHPSETASGNAYGYEEGVPYKGSKVDHISVADSQTTRIVFKSTGKAFAKAIVGKNGNAFSVSADESKCSEETCELVISGKSATPSQDSEEAGEMMYVHFKENKDVMVDSVMVNVYSEKKISSAQAASVWVTGDAGDDLGLSLYDVEASAYSNLKYLCVNKASTIPARGTVKFLAGDAVVPVVMNSVRLGADPYSQLVSLTSKYGVAVHGNRMLFAWELMGSVPDPDGWIDLAPPFGLKDKNLGLLAGRIAAVLKKENTAFLLGLKSGVTVELKSVKYENLRGSVQLLGQALPPGGSHVGVPITPGSTTEAYMLVFEKGNPGGVHIPGKGIIVSTDKAPSDKSKHIGRVLAHEIGHSIGLRDCASNSNIMYYNFEWSDIHTPFSISEKPTVETGSSTPDEGKQFQWEEVIR